MINRHPLLTLCLIWTAVLFLELALLHYNIGT